MCIASFVFPFFFFPLENRIDSQAGAAMRCSSTLLATANGKTVEPQGSHDHTHHVVRKEKDEARILVQHPARQVRVCTPCRHDMEPPLV